MKQTDDSQIFGLEINRDRKRENERDKVESFAPPGYDDGARQIPVNSTGMDALTHSYILSLDAGVASEAELIERYRTVATYPETDMAVEEICNEAIVYDDSQPVVSLNFSDIDEKDLPEATRAKIRDEFDEVLRLMDFKTKGFDVFRRWYIDSRVSYHIITNKGKPKDGIQELRKLDPRKLKKVKEIKKTIDPITHVEMNEIVREYFVYLERASSYNKTFQGHPFGDAAYAAGHVPGTGQGAVKIATDSIAHCHSGLVDESSGIIYGYLQKTIKSFNQLRMLEDALVIYRLARAPERRIFYVDVGNMNATKAEFYVKQMQNRHRNKITYDATTGDVADKRRTMSMQEDFWIPRREGSRGTQIDTLPGGQNLGEIEDVLYFKDKLWNSLNVPPSRFKEEGMASLVGNGPEITREELKFSKFINRLRTQFSEIFHQILRVQLIIKEIVTEEEWNEWEEQLKYTYARDSFYAEARDAEITSNRLNLLSDIENYIGVYFSVKWVQKNVLRMNDEDIAGMQKEIAEEKKAGIGPQEDDEEEPRGRGCRR